MKNKLYLVSTSGLGEFYIVGSDPTQAEEKLLELLKQADYGTLSKRTVVCIKFLAQELSSFAGKPNFTSDKKLILQTTFK